MISEYKINTLMNKYFIDETIKKIEKEGSLKWAINAWKHNKVPSGWYVHGKSPKRFGKSSYVYQLTTSFDTGLQYGGISGIYLLKPKSTAKILDAKNTNNLQKIYIKLLRDFNNKYLSGNLYDTILANAENNNISNKKAILNLVSEMNPKSIVDSAGFWDNTDCVYWFTENFDYDFVITENGGIALNLNKFYIIKLKGISEND